MNPHFILFNFLGPRQSTSHLPLLTVRDSSPSPMGRESSLPAPPPLLTDSSIPDWDHVVDSLDDTGVYEASDNGLRAFVNESPKASDKTARQKTQVDLVLPPTTAFSAPGIGFSLPIGCSTTDHSIRSSSTFVATDSGTAFSNMGSSVQCYPASRAAMGLLEAIENPRQI